MELERRVLDKLSFERGIDLERLHITIGDGGQVTLQGGVRTYADKCAVEEAVWSVPEVVEVRNYLEVRLSIGDYRTDATLERVLREMIDSLARMPGDRPRVSVASGWVTLEGTVPHPFQKHLVESSIREMAGVRGITNRITIENERRTKRPPLSLATF